MKVFVYGTLRSGEDNACYLKDSNRICAQASIKGTLYDTGRGYPAAVEGSGTVYGEVYEAGKEEMNKLDQLEGYIGEGENNLFEKKQRKVTSDSGCFDAWVYYMPGAEEKFPEAAYGDWKIHRLLQHKKKVPYFAYGSCMDTARIKKAGMIDCFLDWQTAFLPGYSLTFACRRKDGARADILEKGVGVEGLLYQLPARAVEYLFRREGVYSGVYRPAVIQVECGGIRLEALTFTVINKEKCSAPPKHYAEEIIRGAARGLSRPYKKKIHTQIYSLMTK